MAALLLHTYPGGERVQEGDRARAILWASALVAECLVSHRPWDEAVGEALRLLGEATGVSRVYVFENHVAEDGTLLTSQRHEWCAPGVEPQMDNPDLQNFPWLAGGFGRWVERMQRGEPVAGPVREFPPAERAVLEPQGILSLVAVPILVEGRWWGFVGFDECHHERRWAAEELAALQLAGRLLGSRLERRRAEAELRLVADLAGRLLTCTSWQQLAEAASAVLREPLGADGLTVLVVEPTGTHLEVVAASGDPPVFREGTVLPLCTGRLCAGTAVSGSAHFVPDLESPELPFRLPAALRRAGVCSLLLLPLVSGTHATGCVVLDYRRPTRPDPARVRSCEASGPLLAVAAERVREHTNHLSLFHRVPVGLYRSTPDGTLLQVNRHLADLLGYPSPEALLARKAAELYADPQDRERWRQRMDTAGAVDGFEVQMVRADGQRVWVVESARTVFGTGGRPLYYDGCVVDVTDRRALWDQVLYLSRHDPLTGVLNREHFLRELGALLDAGRRPALLLVDLNDFHQVNERFGPAVGDRALQWVAQTLRGALRSTDAVARVGGDRFAVAVPGAGGRTVRRVAERLLRALRAPAVVGEVEVRVSPRCGAAVPGRTLPGAVELLRAAEAALELAKSGAGLHVARAGSRGRPVPWEERIRRALSHHGLALFCQPILDLRTAQLDRWELLLRLREGSRWLGPDRFLPEAERSGLVVELDLWVLRQALDLAGSLPGYLHVNFSGRTVSDPEAVENAVRLLRGAPERASKVVVEITETSVLLDLREAAQAIRALKAAGASVALDDFGVGYSSLAHLRHLQVDALKIAGSFVHEVAADPRSRHLVRSLVEMGHALGCLVIAEWVEDAASLEVLRAFGADCAQGFYIARPAPLPQACGVTAASPRRS